MAIRLNHQGWSVAKISSYLGWAPQTVRVALTRWLELGLAGLWDQPRSGRRRRWSEVDWQEIEKWLVEDRGYTSKQLAEKWRSERKIEVGSEQIRRILKKKDWRWKRIRRKPPSAEDNLVKESKKIDLKMRPSMGRTRNNHINVFR